MAWARCRWKRLGGWGLLLAGCLLAAFPVRADQVTLRAEQREGAGRLTFSWPQPVGHQATRQGDRLVVVFSRPIEADLRPVLRALGAYIASIEPAPNEATVVFRLKGDFKVRSFDSGSSVVVDVVGAATPTVTAAPAPAPAAPTKAVAGEVPVRLGTHPDYSRLVFDWPAATAFTVSRDGDKALLSFERDARVNLASVAKGVRNIASASAASVGGKLVVTLGADPTSRINAFASGTKVVVDVYAPGTQAAAPAAAPTSGAQTAQAPATSAPATPAPITPEPATPASAALEPQAAQTTPQTAPETTSEAAPAAAPVALTPDAAGAAVPPAPAPTPTTPAPQAVPVVREPPVAARVQAQAAPQGVASLRFDWDEPVGAAVFRRSGALWVVFDKRAKVDTAALVRDGGGMIVSAEQVPSTMGAVLRLTTKPGVNPDLKRAGLAWILDFMEQPLMPASPLQADAQPNSPLGARVFLAVPEPGNVIAFRDPEVGDNLAVVPVIPLGHGVARTWSYPQMQVLPSKQGVVIKPVSDDLRVRALRQGVEVTSTGTLQVSDVSPEAKANVELEAAMAASAGMDARPMTRVLDLEKWKREDLQDITKIRKELQGDILAAKTPPEKEKARRELAMFFFANGLEAEALGVLEVMRADRPEIENEPVFRMVRGAASWLMGRMADARADLFHAGLTGTDEATFWRAAVVAGEGNLPDAALELRKTGSITGPYPKALKMPTATLVAEAAVELGDVKQAGQYLEVLGIENPTEAQKNQIDFVTGKLKELSGEPDAAVAAWESVMEGVHRPSRAKAAVARTELLLKQGHFTAKDAIEEFEKLRFVWRGDDFEFALLRRLGSIYIQESMFREGLGTLRQAVTNFPEHKETNQITKQMSDTFHDLYLKDGADVLAPVTAIALYDEFRELTPPGALGDEMIRKLADRLVGVDLLDRAAELLESQVDFRLKGEEKARVGARLTLIYLLDRKYQNALDVLNKTDIAGLPEQLGEQRVLLRAQAHIGLGQPEVALDLLRPEVGLEADKMRAGIYWRAADWKSATKVLADVVRELDAKPRKPLTDQQAWAVLSLAVASTLDNNEASVSRTVANFGQAMASGPFADAFRLITDPPELGLVDYRALDQVAKKVEDFQGFMEVYRQRVTEGQLSSLY